MQYNGWEKEIEKVQYPMTSTNTNGPISFVLLQFEIHFTKKFKRRKRSQVQELKHIRLCWHYLQQQYILLGLLLSLGMSILILMEKHLILFNQNRIQIKSIFETTQIFEKGIYIYIYINKDNVCCQHVTDSENEIERNLCLYYYRIEINGDIEENKENIVFLIYW